MVDYNAKDPLRCKSHENWIDHVRTSLAFVLSAGSSILMTGLYSRVVYALWFRRSSNNEIPPQQQVTERERLTFSTLEC